MADREPTHAPDVDLEIEPDGTYSTRRKDGRMVCDFCNRTPVVCEFPCGDFLWGLVEESDGSISEHWNRGGYLACEACRKLVDAGEYVRLVNRQCQLWIADNGTDPMRASLEASISLFVKHRQGPAVPFTP